MVNCSENYKLKQDLDFGDIITFKSWLTRNALSESELNHLDELQGGAELRPAIRHLTKETIALECVDEVHGGHQRRGIRGEDDVDQDREEIVRTGRVCIQSTSLTEKGEGWGRGSVW